MEPKQTEDLISLLLEEGLDLNFEKDSNLQKTPKRIAEMLCTEFFSSLEARNLSYF